MHDPLKFCEQAQSTLGRVMITHPDGPLLRARPIKWGVNRLSLVGRGEVSKSADQEPGQVLCRGRVMCWKGANEKNRGRILSRTLLHFGEGMVK